MVSTLGGVGQAVNTALDGVDYATKSLEASALNRTEMAIIKKKKAMIEGVFGLKRRAMKAIAGFWNDSVNSIHNAAEAVHNGIESIHNGIDNGIESIHNGIDEGKKNHVKRRKVVHVINKAFEEIAISHFFFILIG